MSPRSLRRFLSTNTNAYRSSHHPTKQIPGYFWQKPRFSTTVKMSSIGGAGIGAGLYAAVSNPGQVLSQPEEAAAKAHHLKNGKGFTNPWDSYGEMSGLAIFWGIFSYVQHPRLHRKDCN
jgi:hypothetical protein